jgi:hypothetical protein
MTITKWVKGMAVQVLQVRDGKPKWVGGYIFVRSIDGMTRVQQVAEGPGHKHITTWTHDRVRPDVSETRFF